MKKVIIAVAIIVVVILCGVGIFSILTGGFHYGQVRLEWKWLRWVKDNWVWLTLISFVLGVVVGRLSKPSQ